MEGLILELLGELGEILCEFLLQILAELTVSVASRGIRRLRVGARKYGPGFSAVLFALLGVIAGGLSLFVFPHPLLHPSKLHGISILLSPLMTGFVMSGLGRTVQRRGRMPARIETFAYGFTFALGMALMRFIFAQ